jgi:glycosyltransferase involved in cell wall biosynthesis
MRVAIVHRDLHKVTRGGICTVYRNVAQRLHAMGHEVILITQKTDTPLDTMPGLRVIELPRTEDLAKHRRTVTAALLGVRPDVVESSTWEAELGDYVLRPVDWRARVLVRADLTAQTMGIPEFAQAEGALVEAADKVVAVGSWTAADVERAYGIRPLVVPNGVDRDLFNPGPANSPLSSGNIVDLDNRGQVVGFEGIVGQFLDTDVLWDRLSPAASGERPVRLVWVGKMTKMKGFDQLQDIVRALRGRAVFTILIGHGWVEYPVTISGEPHVQFLQDLDDGDVPRIYRSADYKLTTSRWEGFGLADAESLACGTPVLMPRELGTAEELLTDGVTGATWHDTEDLTSLLDSRPELRGALPPQFDWDVNAATTAKLYEELLTARSTGRR